MFEKLTPHLAAVDALMARLDAHIAELYEGRDRSVVYALVLRLFVSRLRRALIEDFADPNWAAALAGRCVGLYFDAVRANASAKVVPEPWRTFFDAVRTESASSLEILCLGLNAQIVHDLPVAEAGLLVASGEVVRGETGSLRLGPQTHVRRSDHEIVEELLQSAAEEAQDAICTRLAWWLALDDVFMLRSDDRLIYWTLRGALRGVWSFAIALATAGTEIERRAVRTHLVDLARANARAIDLGDVVPSLRRRRAFGHSPYHAAASFA